MFKETSITAKECYELQWCGCEPPAVRPASASRLVLCLSSSDRCVCWFTAVVFDRCLQHFKKGNGQKRELPVGSWPETGGQEYDGSKHSIWAHVIGQHHLPPVSGRTPTGTSRFSLLRSAPIRFWPNFVPFCCSSPVNSI